jgi:membrane protein implicated in regulation of membrane protease activity
MEIGVVLTPWHWLGLGLVLLIVEILVAGFFFLWPAIAALIVGIALFVAPGLAWELQVGLFSVMSVASVWLWRRHAKKNPVESDHPTLNRRGHQYVGRRFTLGEAIVNGNGRLRVDDTVWRIEGPDLAPGCTVKVVGVDGTVLRVERSD